MRQLTAFKTWCKSRTSMHTSLTVNNMRRECGKHVLKPDRSPTRCYLKLDSKVVSSLCKLTQHVQRYFSNDIADTKHWHTYRLCNPTSDGCDLSPVHRQCWTYGRARSPGTASSPIPLWWVQRLGIQQQQPAVPVEYIRKGYDKQRAQPLNVFRLPHVSLK